MLNTIGKRVFYSPSHSLCQSLSLSLRNETRELRNRPHCSGKCVFTGGKEAKTRIRAVCVENEWSEDEQGN